MVNNIRALLVEADIAGSNEGALSDDQGRSTMVSLLHEVIEELVTEVERQEARIKELENWRTS